MTTLLQKRLIKKAEKLKDGFFENEPIGLGFIYDNLLELPSLLRGYNNQIGKAEYDKINDQLKKYEKAIEAVRALNEIEYVFS